MKNLENVSNNHRKEDLKLLFYGILVGIAAEDFQVSIVILFMG